MQEDEFLSELGPPWHILSAESVAAQLDTTDTGLSTAAAATRRARWGANELVDRERRPWWRMLLGQFTDFMIVVLLAAAVISGLIGEAQDTVAIVVIVALNAIIGTVQEYRAERAVAALRAMAAPEATVLRDGEAVVIPARELVPGDVVLLEAGNVVPADLRLVRSAGLQANESALTGESRAVEKVEGELEEIELPLGDRRNMAFKGTQITRGHGRGLVTATGMRTQIGHIAQLLHGDEGGKTPLQKRLASFGQRLAVAILAICLLIFVAGLMRGEQVVLMLLTAISLAVAAIPEALPAVVTVSLALGAAKMSKRNALVRRLPAVETLGSVTFICSDKTGTLTENRMRVERVVLGGNELEAVPTDDSPLAVRLRQALALSNDVKPGDGAALLGDPTEVALYEAAQRAGGDKAALEAQMPRLAERAFDAERKLMTTLHRDGDRVVAFCKGAPEHLLPLCRSEQDGRAAAPFDALPWLDAAERLAHQGYRVLALAYGEHDTLPKSLDGVEEGLTLLGLAALIDPPREGAREAVDECRAAGIVPVMITGDHPGTAYAIALRLGIAAENDTVLTGRELQRMSQEEFEVQVERVRVYARVTPEQKIRIVRALQDKGEFAAMTGDGVNDAPALRRADIGVAMGMKGTDVAREAADMVLLDDDFVTIVSAVREGRRIYDNIRKFVKYTMTSNSGEIWTLLLAPFLGLPLPLLPIHILWINLVTDGLPGLALAAEPHERNIMRRPPRLPRESIFAHGMWQHMVWVGLLIGALSLLAQAWAYDSGWAHWQTIVFTVLTFAQLVHVLVIRSERESLFSIGLFSNLPLLGAVLVTVALQLGVIYLPWANAVFRTAPLSVGELLICFGLPLVVLVAVEGEKWAARRGWIYREAKATKKM